MYYARFSNLKDKEDNEKMRIIERVILIEKCFAKVYGHYKNLRGGEPDEAFMMLANSCTNTYKSSNKY